MKKAALMLVAAALFSPGAAAPQGAVDPSHGLIAVSQALKGLGSVKRVLVIGAHPDDEDTALLAVMVRGHGAAAAYLSVNRGEGGQNLLGPELGVGLGIVRTEELLAARRLDGAVQYFTRGYDFGYSKSAEETFAFWPRDSLLADVVYVVRRFRPQVIVSIFSGTSRDGHGQHQVAGILAREAYDAAGDPDRFPEQLAAGLAAWSPLKLYRSTRFDRAATTLRVETGTLDLVLGRSYHQIAMASRSQHRSQDMGRIETLGPAATSLELVDTRVKTAAGAEEKSIFDGIDTTLAGLLPPVTAGKTRDELAARLAEYRALLKQARDALGHGAPATALPQLSTALATLRAAIELAARSGDPAADLHFVLTEDEGKLGSAVVEAAGVIIDAFSDDDLVVPGQSFEGELQIWNGGDRRVGLETLNLRVPDGWKSEALSAVPDTIAPGTLLRARFRLTVPERAEPSRPYFLRVPLTSGLYAWPNGTGERAMPFGPPVVEAEVELSIAGAVVEARAETVYRFADQARGEVRWPIRVVPAVSLSVTPDASVWPIGDVASQIYTVSLRGEAPNGLSGRIWLEAPPGWEVSPEAAGFELPNAGRTTAVDFRVEAPADIEPAAYQLTAVAETPDGQSHRLGYSIIEYPHIRRNVFFASATARISAFQVEIDPELRVAFVPGAGDAAAEAIKGLGVPVDVLDVRALASGDLSRYDVVVLGIRAYETNAALVASNERLLEWVEAGGTLIVQYQQYDYFRGSFAPYPMRARFPHDRVSDERALVSVLLPDHPAFNQPNRIGPADFDGWVQERGLYFPNEWDDRYQALLEVSDPGDEPKRGSILVAPYGSGLYVYTGLALFRQLPAGVPGAYRLLANLLSLSG
jgi:LmbE family N-acetylglucosaminyl deacetylase